MTTPERFCAFEGEQTRRAFLGQTTLGLGSIALASLLQRTGLAASSAPITLRPKAKRVIFLFMGGGLSQLDLFDEKPLLNERRGEELPDSVRKGQRITGVTVDQGALPVVGSFAKFQRWGKSGLSMAEIVPHMGEIADEMTLIKSLQCDFVLHEAATTQMFTGTAIQNRPSFGAWLSYGLGSENANLPEFVVMLSDKTGQPLHSRIWGNGFLPGRYQGVQFRSGGDPVLFVSNPPGLDDASRANVLKAVKGLNEIEYGAKADPDIRTRIHAYEMAARMQVSLPELADLKTEPKEILELYGAEPGKDSFANNCLFARRLIERGVRFVQLCDRGWDHHFSIPKALKAKCDQVDKPAAALVKDLKQRGLLDDTIVVFTGEFGRTSYCEGPLTSNTYGRDHNSLVNSVWIAGGGFKGGFEYGRTDDWGWDVVEKPVHVHDLQATILHCLGIDHTKLIYRYQGRDFRLTDVGGNVVNDVLA